MISVIGIAAGLCFIQLNAPFKNSCCFSVYLTPLLISFPLTHIYSTCRSDIPPSSLSSSLSSSSLIQTHVFALYLQPVQHRHLPLTPDSTDIYAHAQSSVQLLLVSRCCPKLTCAGTRAAYFDWNITGRDQFTQGKGDNMEKLWIK